MAKNNNLQDFLKGIADTIREENGSTELINPQDFESKITEIADKFRKFVEGTLTEIKASDLKGVTSIPDLAFHSKSLLKSVVLPDSVKEIGMHAFGGCTALETVVLPPEAFDPDYTLFYDAISYEACQNIKNLTAPADIVYNNSFPKIVNVVVNSGTIIDDNFLSESITLESVVLPNSIESIGETPFYNCSNLSSIIIEDGNEYYRSSGNCIIDIVNKVLLQGCNASVIPDDNSIVSIKERAFLGMKNLPNANIPNGVVDIGNRAFYNCSGMLSLSIPDTVETIGEEAFYNCKGLSSITVEDGNTVYHSYGNCLIETQSKTLLLGCKNSVLPDDDSVTSIGAYAFGGCSGLTSISIPNSVISIGGNAFVNCTGLTSISIPNSVISIDGGAFSMCGLTSISIPSSVTSIGGSAFYYCKNLTSVIYEGQPVMSTGIYSYCTKVAKYDFRNATSVPTLSHQSHLGHATGCKIIVPDALYASWKSATNWSALTGVTWVKASEYTEE